MFNLSQSGNGKYLTTETKTGRWSWQSKHWTLDRRKHCEPACS